MPGEIQWTKKEKKATKYSPSKNLYDVRQNNGLGLRGPMQSAAPTQGRNTPLVNLIDHDEFPKRSVYINSK